MFTSSALALSVCGASTARGRRLRVGAHQLSKGSRRISQVAALLVCVLYKKSSLPTTRSSVGCELLSTTNSNMHPNETSVNRRKIHRSPLITGVNHCKRMAKWEAHNSTVAGQPRD